MGELNPLVKIWVIQSKAQDKVYLVYKMDHSVCDGLDLLQVFSLMQDDKAAMVNNAIQRPEKPSPGLLSVLINLPWSLAS